MMVKIYSRFEVPESSAVEFGESCTQQHFKDECDINNIVKSYRANQPAPPCYFDDCTVTDLQEAYFISENMQERFMALPSDVRARFNHDPVELLHFVGNSDNLTLARELGLLSPAPAEEPIVPHPPVPPVSAAKNDVTSTTDGQ